jgi:DnaJ-class molecular chaperone
LHRLTAPQFGKRENSATNNAPPPTPEERYRQMLGLPLGRRLSGAEIHQAYKRVAKRAHPDGGGSAREFLELSAAREALMKERWGRAARG